MEARVVHADCLAAMREMPDASVDSLVTDPPAGIGFMGKSWDHHKGGRAAWVAWMTEVMAEALRVLKPGAHGFVWALPRTSHWTATALEDAGFEVRDIVTHLFGTGFPKSLGVSKAIDKAAGAEREVVGTQSRRDLSRPPGVKGDYLVRDAYAPDAVIPITAPATDEAKQWQGWGTALKPASEHWILVRKPLAETSVARQVLATGTGAVNIDASRIGTEPQQATGRWPANVVLSHAHGCNGECAPDCAVAELDRQSGTSKSTKIKPNPDGSNRFKTVYKGSTSGPMKETGYERGHEDSGGASRFFYVPKARSKERPKVDGVTHPTVKSLALMAYLVRMVTPPGGVVLDPFAGSGATLEAARDLGLGFVGIEAEESYVRLIELRLLVRS